MIENLSGYSARHFIPFVEEVYFRLFERQFEAWWPAHLLLAAIGAAAFLIALSGKSPRTLSILLSLPFAVSAVTFHFQLYAEITPVGRFFGIAFLVQIPLLLLWGFTTKPPEQPPRPAIHSATGTNLALFGLIIYPLVTLPAAGAWSGAEYFGMAPDPTVCFTLGTLLICARPMWYLLLLPVPLLWAATTGATLEALGTKLPMTLPTIAVIATLAAIFKAVSGIRATKIPASRD